MFEPPAAEGIGEISYFLPAITSIERPENAVEVSLRLVTSVG
jgi:hypothetical protein